MKIEASFTKTHTQFIEIEFEGGKLFRIGKEPNQVAWILNSKGVLESRLFGTFVCGNFIRDLPAGMAEGDVLSQLEAQARETNPHGHPKLVVVRAGDLRSYTALCSTVNVVTGDGVPEMYMLSIPAIGL